MDSRSTQRVSQANIVTRSDQRIVSPRRDSFFGFLFVAGCADNFSLRNAYRLLFAVCVMVFASGIAESVMANDREIVDEWRYVTEAPAEGWQTKEFDDSGWQEGFGGFGTRRTPGARIGTEWKGRDIWLRKVFAIDEMPKRPALLIHHDDEAEVFLNGRPAASFQRWTTAYIVVPLSSDAANLLRSGENLLAVHCRQDAGGQFIDVHVIDADNVPELPRPHRGTDPYKSTLITRWGETLSPDNVWSEYPRPLLRRSSWLNLNGHWDYTVAPDVAEEIPETWSGKILVPFCLESRLGGVQRLLNPDEALWYRRTFHAAATPGKRTLLNFEAVDYRCRVFVNGVVVGEHQGGNTPFTFDVTDAIQQGDNIVVVRVEDETEGWQLRGKQVLEPGGIWYTQVSGIWQTVWLEEVPAHYIQDVQIRTEADTGLIVMSAHVTGDGVSAGHRIRVRVRDGDRVVAEGTGDAAVPAVIHERNVAAGDAVLSTRVLVPDAKLWSPSSPFLYDLSVTLEAADGRVLDQAMSYTGIRSLGKVRDENGHLRFTLNGTPVFHLGPLDQGWWPDGLLTPPSEEAMLFDIEFLRDAGFNMIRKHIKVEPRRYYYHCDRLGMMVWQDQVSGGRDPAWTRLDLNPVDADWPDAAHAQFLYEFDRMITALGSHPSIVVWTPFNEAWGQHRTLEVGEWARKRDPSRPINIASGGNFWPTGDIVDHHEYPHPNFPFDPERYRDFIMVVGEYGGHGFPTAGHMWEETDSIWGYGGLPKTLDELKNRYRVSTERLSDLKKRGIAAGVYTQTTDVEIEVNGLMTYDRKVIKITAEDLRRFHQLILESN